MGKRKPEPASPRSSAERLAQAEAIARRRTRRELGLVSRGDRAVLGIGCGAELLAHVVLGPDALLELSARAAAIAAELRPPV